MSLSPLSKLRVGFEVTNLETVYHEGAWRGGIFRVTCSVLRAASRRDDIEPVLIVNNDLVSYAIVDRFIRSTPDLKHLPVESPWQFTFLARFIVWLMYDIFPSRIWRGRVFRQLQRLQVRKRVKPKFDVIYSFYLGLKYAHRSEARARFLLVHDIIPLLKPEYCGFTEPSPWFRGLMDSIDVERDWIASISESTKRDYCSFLGRDPDRVFVTPLAAEKLFHPVDKAGQDEMRDRLKIPAGRYLLSLCTLEPRKNLAHIIRCFGRMLKENRDKFADVYLVLAGAKGWDYDPIFKEIEAMGEFSSRVFFVGRVPDEEIAALYSGASAFVYPSLYEGFGLPPLEAMQCGTPVITSNTSSLPEVVGDAGLMVDPHDADALCQAMVTLLESPELAAEWSRRGLARAQTFSWDHFMEGTVKAFRKVLEREA